MKTHLLFLATFFVSFSLLAQEGQFAPLNPDFVRYQDNIKAQTNLKSAELNKFGYAPSPLQLNFENYKEINSMQTSKNISGVLPSRYDLRDLGYLTSVKSQSGGTCWANATMAAIESNWLVNHWGSYDLSEQNMASCNGINSKYNEGGEGNISSAYLTRFSGPLLETDDPNKAPANNDELNENICKNIKAHPPRYVLSSKFLPPDIELIKKTIMTSGGVCAILLWGNESENYNWRDYTFYNPGNVVVNYDHMVLLVGWDDNKEVTGGTKSPKGTKGAWIAKNSWGSSFGEKGFFYLSYYDKCAMSEVFYFDESADTTEIDQLNMYDDLGASRAFGFEKEVAYGLTKFTAPAKAIIKKIGTYIISASSSVDIEIYKAFADGKLSGLLYSKKNIHCEFPGQRVFDVMAVVEDEYYVKIKYNTPACFYPIAVESYIKNGLFKIPDIRLPGTNWVSTDGEKWEAIGLGIEGKEMDLTIRSYTISADKPYGFFDLSQKQLCICDSLSICAELSDPGIDCKWQFLPDGSPMEDSGPVPAKVKFATTGLKEIQLIMHNKNGYDTISRNLDVVNSLDVEIYSSFENKMGYVYGGRKIPYQAAGEIDKPLYLSVSVEADSFKWNPPYDTLNASGIYVTPKNIGPNSYNVTAIRGTCRGSDTIQVEGFSRPVNDNIRNAAELKEGVSGLFANFWATVEANEPAPPFKDCGALGGTGQVGFWCPDGGLQNSVWFSFTAINDSVKVFTDGTYNQIAVYDANSLEDLKNNQYKVLAAYDDNWSPQNGYNKKIALTDLVVGKKYWVQYDGGIGGSNEIFKMGIHYPKYFAASVDTLYLESNSSKSKPSTLIVQADSLWTVSRMPNSTWFEYTPNKGLGKGTISIYSKTTNTGSAQRIGGLTFRSPLYENKNIVIIQLVTGIDPKAISDFMIYPNPTKEFIVFDWLDYNGLVAVEIYDLLGKKVLQQKLTENKQVFVGNLPNGLYAYRIYDGEKYHTGKVIKE
jgi:C1A family cysteine protease